MSEHNHEFTGGGGGGSKFRTAASFINHRLTDVLLERKKEKKERKKARAGDRNLPRIPRSRFYCPIRSPLVLTVPVCVWILTDYA